MFRMFFFIFIIGNLLVVSAEAGSQASSKANFTPQQIVALAKGVETYAAQKGARVFILSRVGRPKADLPRGIQFTHTAIAVYSDITLENGEIVNGYAIHNLYQHLKMRHTNDIISEYRNCDYCHADMSATRSQNTPTQTITSRHS